MGWDLGSNRDLTFAVLPSLITDKTRDDTEVEDLDTNRAPTTTYVSQLTHLVTHVRTYRGKCPSRPLRLYYYKQFRLMGIPGGREVRSGINNSDSGRISDKDEMVIIGGVR